MKREQSADGAMSQAILDAMAAQIAVLDRNGTIVAVNESWRRFAIENSNEPGRPAPNTGVGTSYLAVWQAPGCTPAPDASAIGATEGIRAVLTGRQARYACEYPCHAPDRQRWFSMDVTPLATAHGGAVVSHSDVTEACRARQTVEDMAAMLGRTSSIAKVGGWELDLRTRNLSWSQETFRIHEIDAADPPSIAHSIGYYAPESRDALRAAVRASMKSGAPWDYTLPMTTASGRRIWVRGQGGAVMQGGKAILLRGVLMDVTAQMESEQALVASLQEKEALLSEVHHRVKNNLQVITSLLRLEGGRSQEAGTRDAFVAMQGRIRSMALLHESLYRSGSFAAVDLASYLGQIATQAFRAAQPENVVVTLKLDLVPARIAMVQAVPCGLLLNELISNSLKHGFTEGRGGEVRVALQELDGATKLRLRVCDTGVGLPPDFDARRMQRLGLQLASDLAGQLGGTLKIGPEPRAVFSVTFTPDAALRKPGMSQQATHFPP